MQGRGPYIGGSGGLCILSNRKDALLPLIIWVATSPVAVTNLGSGFYVVFSPALFLLQNGANCSCDTHPGVYILSLYRRSGFTLSSKVSCHEVGRDVLWRAVDSPNLFYP